MKKIIFVSVLYLFCISPISVFAEVTIIAAELPGLHERQETVPASALAPLPAGLQAGRNPRLPVPRSPPHLRLLGRPARRAAGSDRHGAGTQDSGHDGAL